MKSLTVVAVLASIGLLGQARGDTVSLGSAGSYAVLGGQAVTNTGPTILRGDLGVWPGSSVTGFPPGLLVGGVMHLGDAAAHLAQNDVTTAYNVAAGQAPTRDLTGMDLGGMTLTPGVYFFSSSAQLTGRLTLNDLGNPAAQFIFQIGSTLTTGSASSVVGADGCNIFWQVGSSATLGTDTSFLGNILALTSITLNTRATILDGRALARNGSVTMDSNMIGSDCVVTPIPTAASLGLIGLALVGAPRRRTRARGD